MTDKPLPYFWDYQITQTRLKRLAKGLEGETSQIWAISRLLESAPYEEIWQFVSLEDLRKIFPKLKLKKPIQKAWQRTLEVWSEQYERPNSHSPPR